MASKKKRARKSICHAPNTRDAPLCGDGLQRGDSLSEATRLINCKKCIGKRLLKTRIGELRGAKHRHTKAIKKFEAGPGPKPGDERLTIGASIGYMPVMDQFEGISRHEKISDSESYTIEMPGSSPAPNKVELSKYNAWRVYAILGEMLGLPVPEHVKKATGRWEGMP